MFSEIVVKTNQTSVFITGKSINISLRELKVWIGINCVMSALQYPKIRMYWEKKWRVPIIADAMARDRFFVIRKSIKVVYDNDITDEQKRSDRLWKLRPLIDRVLKGCLKQKKNQELCVDEMIIPFHGSCSIKQYIPNKPNPVGIKVFVLANPNGVICDFIVYQGQTTFPLELTQRFSLCESVVLRLTESLVPGHILYFDRFFTTVKLAQELNDRGFRCTGTIMSNRIPKNNSFVCEKEFKKCKRGTMAVTVREDNAIALTKWLDNNPVVLLSTNESQEPLCNVKRWSKKENTFIQVSQPKVINSYNKNMGGVDLADRMLAYCPSRARTRKWTVRCIMHFLDLALANAWLQMREVKSELKVPKKAIAQFRTFKLEFGERLIEKNDGKTKDILSEDEEINKNDGRKTPVPSEQCRVQGAKHLPDVTTGIQNRCRQKGCTKKTSVFCIGCKTYLCLMGNRNCFLKFHTK